ncbi:hypothetical protein [Microbacterium sp. GXF6406]
MAGSARFEVDMTMNARGVAAGAKEAEKHLGELGDALEDLDALGPRSAGRAEDALDDLGRAAKDAGRDGERAIDNLEDALRDVQQQSKKTERSVDDIGDVGGKGFQKVREGAQEVTQEVGQNLGEAVSSIRGDLTDLGQVGQDTLGGLAATLAGTGPAGIAGAAALAAGAVGLGLITAEIEAQNERVQALKSYFSDAWREAVEGGRDYIETATIIGEMNDIRFDPDRAKEYKQIQEDAAAYGLEVNTLLQAAAGDEEALNEVRSRGNALLEERKEKTLEAQESFIPGNEYTIDGLLREEREMSNVNERWKERSDIYAENKQNAADAQAAESEYLKSVVENASSAAVEVDELGNKLLTLPDDQQILIDAETGQATLNIDKFQGDADDVVDHVNGRQMKLDISTHDAISAAQSAVNQINGMRASIDITAHANSAISSALSAVQQIRSLKWD